MWSRVAVGSVGLERPVVIGCHVMALYSRRMDDTDCTECMFLALAFVKELGLKDIWNAECCVQRLARVGCYNVRVKCY